MSMILDGFYKEEMFEQVLAEPVLTEPVLTEPVQNSLGIRFNQSKVIIPLDSRISEEYKDS